MEANDLMIGDWMGWLPTWKNEETGEIEWDGDRSDPIIGKVGMLMKDCTTIDYCDESIEVEDIGLIPIPLTPEILEKNGFKPQGTGWILEDSIGERIFNLCRISNAYCLLTAGMTLAFQYVHELQHLFRLAGIKGEIKL